MNNMQPTPVFREEDNPDASTAYSGEYSMEEEEEEELHGEDMT